MERRLLSVIAVLPVLVGCATRGDTPRDRPWLVSQPKVYLTHQTAGPFRVQRGSEAGAVALGGVVGGMAAAASAIQDNFQSARLQQTLDLADPVSHLKRRLEESLRHEWGLTNLTTIAEPWDMPIIPDDTVEVQQEWQRASPGTPIAVQPARPVESGETFKTTHPSGAVIEVVTRHWGMENYRMKYYASARLVDLSRSKVVLSTRCSWVIFEQVDKHKLPGDERGLDAFGRYDPELVRAYESAVEERLYANGGALLKTNLKKAAELCADKITVAFKRARIND